MTIRVLHWFPNFCAGGGVANSVLALARAQAKLGATVVIASRSNTTPVYGPLAISEGVTVETWRGTRTVGRGRMGLDLLGGARGRFEALGPDLVHVHGEFNPNNWWAPRLWHCPVVLTPHGAFHPTVLGRGSRRKQIYMGMAKRLLYRHIARFHALNPAEREDISRALPEALTYYVPQGPSPAVETALCEPEDRRPSAGPIKFMFIGRIDVRTKGLDVLVAAFADALGASAAPASLTLVGPDWRDGARQLAQLAKRLGIGGAVEIRGPVRGADIPTLLRNCDVYVQLSRNEGSPLSLNDAFAFGKPAIVSSSVGTVSCQEIARLSHVRIVPPTIPEAAVALAEAIAGFDELAQSARRSHRQLATFLSWDRAARRHLEEYKSLLAVSRIADAPT